MIKRTSKKAQIVGEITSKVYRQDNKFLQFFNKILRGLELVGLISRATLAKYYQKGQFVRGDIDHNIIATSGFNVLCQILTAEYGDTGAITQMALGDGVGTPAIGDEALFNEVYRNNKASAVSSANIAIITAFYTEVEVDGTFTEFGNFIDDTVMWSHINVSWTKSAAETLTVQCKYTLTNKP